MKDFNLSLLKYFISMVLYLNLIINPKIYTQNNRSLENVFSSNIKSLKSNSNSISFTGSYRFLGFLRNQKEVFPNNNGKTLVILSGDNFREPILLLKGDKRWLLEYLIGRRQGAPTA